MPGKKRAVVSAEFDALTFRSIMDMKFTGPFMSVRQHPQYWDMRIVVTTPMEGGLDIQKTTLRPHHRLPLGRLAPLVKQHVRQMGMPDAISIMVTARRVSPAETAEWFGKKKTLQAVTSVGDSELDMSLTT